MSQYPGTLYDYSAGLYCGVLVAESVMRKLVAAQARHSEEVKRILTDNKDGVFPSSWTLHYPGGVQTSVHFIETGPNARTVEKAVAASVRAGQPVARFPVFYAASMQEAAAMADARHAELTDGATPC